MKILTWNAAMKFREKFREIIKFSPDILVIPECEAPEKWGNSPYIDKIKQFHWFGDNRNKGTGIFILNPLYTMEVHPSYTEDFRYIIPLIVKGPEKFNLFGVWSQLTDKQYTSYIGQIYMALKHYELLLNEPCIIAGDLNSNKIFDHIKRIGNHTQVVDFLKRHSIESAYHSFFKENHGEEIRPTYYFRKEQASPFHLDYIFASECFLEGLHSLEVRSMKSG